MVHGSWFIEKKQEKAQNHRSSIERTKGEPVGQGASRSMNNELRTMNTKRGEDRGEGKKRIPIL